MMPVLEFMFRDVWHWLGSLVLIIVTLALLADCLRATRR